MNRTAAAALCAAFALLPLQAQTFGEIAGAVTDSSGAVVVGASVTVTNAGTNQVRKVESNQSGNFTIPFLVPGLYNVDVAAAGFKTAQRKGVDLQVGAVARLDFSL
ncbi:MAG: carboxypeptidase regulatory-like domain-containing protein, partial [Variibacter sp.]|nr:carboxypeptidase regulatory-like domain-containing protein [Variibacter sp.]